MATNLAERSLPHRAWSVRADNFWGGFSSLFRSFPLSVFPPRKSLWEQAGDDIRECWQEVGNDMRAAMGTYERETLGVREADSREEKRHARLTVRQRREIARFAKNYEKLDPETQKIFLTFVRELSRK